MCLVCLWASALRKEFPKITLLGEMFDRDTTKVAFFQGGRPRFDGVDSGIDSLFEFPLYFKVIDVFAKQKSTIARRREVKRLPNLP